jgi:hypothetical protein
MDHSALLWAWLAFPVVLLVMHQACPHRETLLHAMTMRTERKLSTPEDRPRRVSLQLNRGNINVVARLFLPAARHPLNQRAAPTREPVASTKRQAQPMFANVARKNLRSLIQLMSFGMYYHRPNKL